SKWTFTLNLPFFLLAAIFPQALLGIFGPEFTDGATALVILAFASLTNAATGSSGAILDMTGHTRVKLLNSTASVGLAIVLNLLLIPPLGVTGAAIAAFGSIATVNLLRVAQVAWLVRVLPYDREWLKPAAAGVAAGAAAWLVGLLTADASLFVRALTGGAALAVTYAAVLVALGLSDDDRTILSRAGRRFTRRRGGKAVAAAGAQGDVP
ncbi:MAG TPA: oligosaccharide flippase family protein, partial [Candidatus Limnocylindria bacterium]|nr:oligosaccharide flippase family protein [Candidatus Limnocylindria bacterium]